MAKITISKDNLLDSAEFNRLLKQTTVQSSLLDDVLHLLRELISFEEEYNMGSDIFYARFMRGEMGDDLPFILWAGQYEAYLEAKQELASQLPKATVMV